MNVLSATQKSVADNGAAKATAATPAAGNAAGPGGLSLSSLIGSDAEPLRGIAQLIDAIGQAVAGAGAGGGTANGAGAGAGTGSAAGSSQSTQSIAQALGKGAVAAKGFGPIGGIVGSALGLASSLVP